MAKLKIFFSSTCYDLKLIRSKLRKATEEMGCEPVMSEYGDILYDPRIHTHTSCIEEVKNCDFLILLIGSRFGGSAIQEALDNVDFEALKKKYPDVETVKSQDKISITQLEVLEAMNQGIPIFTFVKDDVDKDYDFYIKNKDNEDLVKNAKFPHIEKQGTAQYIFAFIDFLRRRENNNAHFIVQDFEDVDELTRQFKAQLSGFFQKLLKEQRSEKTLCEHSPKTIMLPRQEMHERYLVKNRLHITDGFYKNISCIRLMNLAGNIAIDPKIVDAFHIHRNDIPLSKALEMVLQDSNARFEFVLSEPNPYNLEDLRTKIAGRTAGSSAGALYSALSSLYNKLSSDTIYWHCMESIPVRFQLFVMKTSIPFSIFNVEFINEYKEYNHVLIDLYSAALTCESNRRSILVWQKYDPSNYQFFVNNFIEIKNNPHLCRTPGIEEMKGWAEIWEKIQKNHLGDPV